MPDLNGRLSVTVAPGYADTEFYVMIPGGSSALVSRDLVSVDHDPADGESVDGQVEVYVLAEDDNDVLVELPGEPIIGGIRARVDRTLLSRTHP